MSDFKAMIILTAQVINCTSSHIISSLWWNIVLPSYLNKSSKKDNSVDYCFEMVAVFILL